MITIIGDSHSSILRQSLGDMPADEINSINSTIGPVSAGMIGAGHELQKQFFKYENGKIRITNRTGRRYRRITGRRPLITPSPDIIYGLSMGCHASVMVRQEYWGQYTITPSPDARSKHFISSAVFRAMVLSENRYSVEFASHLKAMSLPFFVIVSPPIRQRMIDRQQQFASADELINIHCTYQSVMIDEFRRIGVDVLPQPAECFHGKVLSPRYDNPKELDAHHANSDYGRLVWRQIVDFLKKRVNA